jgi:endonuclease YncB( thermonuclease family)
MARSGHFRRFGPAPWRGVPTVLGFARHRLLGILMLRRHLTLAALLALVFGLLASFSTPAYAVDKDCGDFDTQAQAQDYFEDAGSGDPHQLDGDGDGVACESLPCPCSTGSGGGGGDGTKDKTLKQRARVVRVIDGDTVKVRLASGRRKSVRMIGIDTPELSGEECGSKKARRALRRALPRRTKVLLVSDTTQARKDRYGRLLRYVHRVSTGKDMNRAQLRRGLARVYVYNHDPFKRVRKYRRTMKDAKAADKGIWGSC